MRVIKIKDKAHWNMHDSKLVINDRITVLVLTNYWCAVDASFQYNSTRREAFMAKKMTKSAHEGTSDHESIARDCPKDGPMHVFFRKHGSGTPYHDECRMDIREDRGSHSSRRHVEYRMDTREDTHLCRFDHLPVMQHRDNWFLLPQPHHREDF